MDSGFQYAQDPDEGRWFPPLECGEVIHVNAIPRVENRRLYSTDNCPDCTAALQAVELMVYGIAWEMKQWPDGWEHTCFFGNRKVTIAPVAGYTQAETREWFGAVEVGSAAACSCGQSQSITDLKRWSSDVHWAWGDIADKNYAAIATFDVFQSLADLAVVIAATEMGKTEWEARELILTNAMQASGIPGLSHEP